MRLSMFAKLAVLSATVVIFWSCASEQMTSARLYIREENWEMAEEMLLEAVELEPENPEVFFLLGEEIYGRKKNWIKMNEMFDQALALAPDKKLPNGLTVAASIESARLKYWAVYYNKGADTYNKVIQGRQAEATVSELRIGMSTAELESMMGEPERINTTVTEFRADEQWVYPNGLYMYLEGGVVNGFQIFGQEPSVAADNLLTEAIEAFETAKQINPDDSDTYKNLVFAYIQSGQTALLESTLEEALKRRPDDADLLVSAGQVYKDKGEVEKAIEFLEKGMRINPANSAAARFLADIYYDQGDKEGAIFAYQKAIKADPENVDLHFNLGVLYLQIADYDVAEEKFQVVLKLNPNDLEAAMGIGEAYERMEQWPDAEYYYGKALRVEPEDATLLRAMARVVYRQGRIDEAEELLGKAKAIE